MYYYFRELKKLDVNIIGLDLKEDVIAICNGLAEKYGYEKLHFYQGDIASYTGRDEVDMVVTLHACDTATDYALEKAVKWNAKVILSVPCCQHELNRQIANKELYPIMDYGILKERMAALLTDGIRAKLLENAGYETQILEFIDMEHTPKNLLIRAVKRQEGSKKLPEELKVCMEAYHVKPTLADLLTEKEEPVMNKRAARILILFLVFAASVGVFTHLMSHETTENATDLDAASLPVLYMKTADTTVNRMYGYRQEMNGVTTRENLTPLPMDRSLTLEIDAKGQKIINVTYTVESTDGGALIENSVLKSFDEDGSYLKADFQLETAILMNQEYTLKLEVAYGNGQSALVLHPHCTAQRRGGRRLSGLHADVCADMPG